MTLKAQGTGVLHAHGDVQLASRCPSGSHSGHGKADVGSHNTTAVPSQVEAYTPGAAREIEHVPRAVPEAPDQLLDVIRPALVRYVAHEDIVVRSDEGELRSRFAAFHLLSTIRRRAGRAVQESLRAQAGRYVGEGSMRTRSRVVAPRGGRARCATQLFFLFL